MELINFLIMLGIAGLCGYVAAQLMGARRVNILLMILLGFVGAFVGKLIAAFFHFPPILAINTGHLHFPLFWALVGSIVVTGIFSAITRH